jgi:hypothetical protein
LNSTEDDVARHDLDTVRSENNIKALSLGLGALPSGVLFGRLVQATRGYPTAPGQGPVTTIQNPNEIFDLIKALIDAEIQLFIQGFITLDQLSAYIVNLGFVTAKDVTVLISQALSALPQIAGLTITDIDNEINRLVPGLVTGATDDLRNTVKTLQNDVSTLEKAFTSLGNAVKKLGGGVLGFFGL